MAANTADPVSNDIKKSAEGDMSSLKNETFERLPDEIIEQILQLTTPNSFASLIILNRKWRMVSQQAYLYAHHLSRCPSYSAAHNSLPVPENDDSLPRLRRLFAQEIKRNLFEAYLRPKETIINLVSTSISSSSAPGGEAFHFSLSPRGHYVLAYSSSRIHVLDVKGKEVTVKRELKILRRPASTTITDDGSLLAVLSTDMQVDLYDLSGEHPKHTRAVALDHTPRTIALSPTGSVLAAAYDSGVEVSSLDPDCLSTERRAVKCYTVDFLSFSRDGTQLLGTTIQSRNPSTVVLTAPYYDPGGNLPEESTSALWTTSILFPNGSRDCSHAVLLPNASEDEANWTFTYDRVFETFRAVRIDDLRNGTTYFTGPTADTVSKLLPSTLPAASEAGDLVVSGFQGSIWLYGVPEDLEALPNVNGSASNMESEASTPLSQLGRRNSAPSLKTASRPRDCTTRTPQWQILCDKFRNNFVEGQKIACLDRVSAMTWVNDFSTSVLVERLVAVAPGVGGHAPESEDDGMNPTDGGRISILDFGYDIEDGKKRIITIEVGNQEPQVLEEEHRDLDTEVALVRRRTVAQRRGNRSNVTRSATTATARPTRTELPRMPNINDLGGSFGIPALPASRPSLPPLPSADASETASIDEDEEAFDAPYSQTNPRSTTTLRRAATAAAVNRRLHPRTVAQGHIEYRRADGRQEHPHESDADNWVPPPPPYSKDPHPIPPLPEHIQRSILAEAAAVNLQRANTYRAPSIDFPGLDGNSLHRSRTLASVSSGSPSQESRRDRFPFPRTNLPVRPISADGESDRHAPSPVSPYDDLYDVSPPGSPLAAPRRLSEPIPEIGRRRDSSPDSSPEITLPVCHQITRKPVGPVASPTTAPLAPTLSMRATIKQPISPVPQPQPTPENLNRRLLDWEARTDSSRAVSSDEASERMEEASPSHGNYHPEGLSPNSGVLQREIEPKSAALLSRRSDTAPTSSMFPRVVEEGPFSVSRRAETAPVQLKAGEITMSNANMSPMYNMSMPSAEQLARLNSRKERPPSQILADPRRASASFSQPQLTAPIPGSSRRVASEGQAVEVSSWDSKQLSPPHGNETFRSQSALGAYASSPARSNTTYSPHTNYSRLAPNHTPPHTNGNDQSQIAMGSYGSSPARSNTTYSPHTNSSRQTPSQPPQHPNYSMPQANHYPPSRRLSLNAPPHNQSRLSPVAQSPVNIRPNMQRLETIHSITSADPSSYPPQKPMAISIARNPSRAERSAAKNIKDAKKRGWRASMRKVDKKKEKWNDASSAGWTDVSDLRSMAGDGAYGSRDKKSGKCSVM